MKPFAKIYGTDNQILVKQDRNEDGNPEVRIYFQPEDLGVCSFAISWDDNEEGWNQSDVAFEKMTEERVRSLVKEQIEGFHLTQKNKS